MFLPSSVLHLLFKPVDPLVAHTKSDMIYDKKQNDPADRRELNPFHVYDKNPLLFSLILCHIHMANFYETYRGINVNGISIIDLNEFTVINDP